MLHHGLLLFFEAISSIVHDVAVEHLLVVRPHSLKADHLGSNEVEYNSPLFLTIDYANNKGN